MSCIGKLNKRVIIEQVARATDAIGGSTETFTTFATVWAQIKPLTGNERFFSQRVEPNVTHMLKIRHRTGVTTEMRIKFGTRIFEIQSIINPDERNEVLNIMAVEGKAS